MAVPEVGHGVIGAEDGAQDVGVDQDQETAAPGDEVGEEAVVAFSFRLYFIL